MNSTKLGLGAFAFASLAVMATAALLWAEPKAHREPQTAASVALDASNASPSPSLITPLQLAQDQQRASTSDDAKRLVQRLSELLGRASAQNDDERAALERALLDLGEAAATPLIARLQSERDPERQRVLLDLLRKIPGSVAEEYFVDQARRARERPVRALAIDALAERKSSRAFDTLDRIATTDPELPKKPFLSEPRKASDDSTELPDEVTFTPRMQAMTALASTGDARATATLTSILHNEAEESLRMEAARNLGQLRSDSAALDALFDALTDRSAYVRLAALHSLNGAGDPRLAASLAKTASTDSDLGVRALAQRVLQGLSSAP